MDTPRPMLTTLLELALDLTANLAAADRYRHIVAAVQRVVPCDAAALLWLDGDALVPVATQGLRPEVHGRRFRPAEHPRLAQILASEAPISFGESPLPDPFDGLLDAVVGPVAVHACLGCALRVEGEVVGALTADALDPRAFDGVDWADIALLGALAGAAIRTAGLIEALETSARHSETVAQSLLREAQRRSGMLVGTSPAMQALRDEIALLGDSDLPVLITGETGVGKELVARLLHARSRRRDEPVIQVNCAALPESIADSELFGHVRGAFTGAVEARAGRFEAADGGTLLLDEVGELPLSVQAKLLRAIQFGEIQRVGADHAIRVDVRVLAATNRDLQVEVQAGRFRADLFHRLQVYPLHVPPLRDRRDDVPLLAGHFLDEARVRLGLGPVQLSPAAVHTLMSARWPGNVRELQHAMLRAALRAAEGRRRTRVLIEPRHLDSGAPPVTPDAPLELPAAPLGEAVERYRAGLIRAALTAENGNVAAAARRLGLDRSNLHRLVRRLGLNPTR